MKLSSVYGNSEKIPVKYANVGFPGGENISPPYNWSDIPGNTKSFALAIIDRHPVANNFVHWLVIDIPANITGLNEGVSLTDKMPNGSKELLTTYGRPGYGGPRPPAGTGDHPYEATVWVLNVQKLGLSVNASIGEFNTAIEGMIIDSATLTGMLAR